MDLPKSKGAQGFRYGQRVVPSGTILLAQRIMANEYAKFYLKEGKDITGLKLFYQCHGGPEVTTIMPETSTVHAVSDEGPNAYYIVKTADIKPAPESEDAPPPPKPVEARGR